MKNVCYYLGCFIYFLEEHRLLKPIIFGLFLFLLISYINKDYEYDKLYAENQTNITIYSELKEVYDDSIKLAQNVVDNNKQPLEKPLMNSTYDELHKYVNEIHNSKEVIVYSATIDYSRKEKLIKQIMVEVGEKNPNDFTALLVFTEQVETNGGRYTKQKNGPALSTFQIEPTTYNDIMQRVLPKYPSVQSVLLKYSWNKSLEPSLFELEYNYIHSILVAYLVYLDKGCKVPPNKNDKVKQAEVHKLDFNTIKGKSTVSGSLLKTMG